MRGSGITWLSLAVLVSPLACEEEKAPPSAPAETAKAEPSSAPTSEPTSATKETIPVPADFEAEAETAIDASNYRDALKAIEDELGE